MKGNDGDFNKKKKKKKTGVCASETTPIPKIERFPGLNVREERSTSVQDPAGETLKQESGGPSSSLSEVERELPNFAGNGLNTISTRNYIFGGRG